MHYCVERYGGKEYSWRSRRIPQENMACGCYECLWYVKCKSYTMVLIHFVREGVVYERMLEGLKEMCMSMRESYAGINEAYIRNERTVRTSYL